MGVSYNMKEWHGYIMVLIGTAAALFVTLNGLGDLP